MDDYIEQYIEQRVDQLLEPSIEEQIVRLVRMKLDGKITSTFSDDPKEIIEVKAMLWPVQDEDGH